MEISINDLTVYAFKFVIENEILEMESLKQGFLSGKVKDYETFKSYYEFKLNKPAARVTKTIEVQPVK